MVTGFVQTDCLTVISRQWIFIVAQEEARDLNRARLRYPMNRTEGKLGSLLIKYPLFRCGSILLLYNAEGKEKLILKSPNYRVLSPAPPGASRVIDIAENIRRRNITAEMSAAAAGLPRNNIDQCNTRSVNSRDDVKPSRVAEATGV